MKLKNIFDRTLSALGLFAGSPLFVAIAAAVALDSGGPVLFRQRRIGQKGKPFYLLKFRSMYHTSSGPRITALGDRRVTRVGSILRKYKLDELPQLWNVLVGEMSLVGPRPELPAFVDLDNPAWQRVLEAKPGITDLATLIFRSEEELLAGKNNPEDYYRQVMLQEKLKLNFNYINNQSCWRDLELILISVWYSLMPSRFHAGRVRQRFLGAETAPGVRSC